MINITKNNNSIVITSDNPYAFPFQNGQLTVPVNSITYTLDQSDYIAFRSAANNDVLFTGNIGEIQIDGIVVTRDEFVASFNAIAFASTSGGGGGSVDPEIENIAKRAVKSVTYVSQIGSEDFKYTLDFFDANNRKVDSETITLGLVTESACGLVSPLQKTKIDNAVSQIRLTQEEYDAIPEDYRDSSVIYVITDAPEYVNEEELAAAFVAREWVGTQEQYDALGSYDAGITYFIIEE